MNLSILKGRLGNDPETYTYESGDIKVSFRLATTEKWTKNGEKKEKTQWHQCVCYRKTAEIAQEYCRKGQEIVTQGKVEYRKYEKDGQEKWITEIIVDRIDFCGSKSDNEATPADDGVGF
jgi:single-strand DNA-binding protein